jgi:hypothetical protein
MEGARVRTRRTAVVISALLAWVAAPRLAAASGGCIYVASYGPNLSGNQCGPNSGWLAGGVVKAFNCDTGASSLGNCGAGGAVAAGVPNPYPGCFEAGQVSVGPIVVDSCGANPDDPPACKSGVRSKDLRRSSAGVVGDPVDLRSRFFVS